MKDKEEWHSRQVEVQIRMKKVIGDGRQPDWKGKGGRFGDLMGAMAREVG